MWFHSITAEYNGPLEAAQAHNDDVRYDMAGCGASSQPKVDLSEQLRRCSVAAE